MSGVPRRSDRDATFGGLDELHSIAACAVDALGHALDGESSDELKSYMRSIGRRFEEWQGASVRRACFYETREEPDGPYLCSGADYHLPACGGCATVEP